MQRLCSKLLRSLALQATFPSQPSFSSSPRLFLHSSPHLHRPLHFAAATAAAASDKWRSLGSPILNRSSSPIHSPSLAPFPSSPVSPSPLSLVQVRHVSSRDRRKKKKPLTPTTSKVKKIKMKFFSSYKSRFRPLNDGTIRRWREGKNHNAHLKSKKSRRRLRQPSTVPAAYATVMKKLSFCA